MKHLSKWDYSSQSYKDYEVPDSWNVCLFTSDMELLVDCCQCGSQLKYGDSYTSKEVHNFVGLGYAVCEDCYAKEHIRELENT